MLTVSVFATTIIDYFLQIVYTDINKIYKSIKHLHFLRRTLLWVIKDLISSMVKEV